MPVCWSRDYFLQDPSGYKCTICGKVYPHLNASNFKYHLKSKHNISNPHGKPKLTLNNFPVQEEKWRTFVKFVCSNDEPLSVVENPYLRRMVGDYGIWSRQTLRKRIMQFAGEILNQNAEKLKGMSITLAIDSGTVWQRYFGIVGVTPIGPVMLGLIADSWLEDGKLTTANIAKFMRDVVTDLEGRGITVAAIVADNAYNMQGLKDMIAFVPVIRCLPHTLALITNDLYELDKIRDVIERAKGIRQRATIKLKEPCDTRWNSQLALISDIITKRDKLNEDISGFGDVEQWLQPFLSFTNLAQGDDARLFIQLIILKSLVRQAKVKDEFGRALNTSVRSRWHQLFLGAPMVLTYLLPCCDRSKLTPSIAQSISEYIEKMMQQGTWRSGFANLVAKEPIEMKSTAASTIKLFSKHPFMTLGQVVDRLLGMCPTEASVERMFSAVKDSIYPKRSNTDPDLVQAVMLIKTQKEFRSTTELHDDEHAITTSDCNEFFALMRTCIQQPVTGRKRGRAMDLSYCGDCGKLLSEHPGGENEISVECSHCKRWFSTVCINLDDFSIEHAKISEWFCQSCTNEFLTPTRRKRN